MQFKNADVTNLGFTQSSFQFNYYYLEKVMPDILVNVTFT